MLMYMVILEYIPSMRRMSFPENGVTQADWDWIVTMEVEMVPAMLEKPELLLMSMMKSRAAFMKSVAVVGVPVVQPVDPLAVTKYVPKLVKDVCTSLKMARVAAFFSSVNPPGLPVVIWLLIMTTSTVVLTV